MNKQTFIQLIKDPSGISAEQLMELEKVVAGFPYCQSAHILIAKQASDTGSMLADQKLKKAAAYTLDRKNLKRLLSGSKERELPEIKSTLLRELPVLDIPIKEIPVENGTTEETIVATKEEAIETIENKIQEEKTIQETKVIETSSTKEALTDAKRDEIIRELQENLKRLHDIKIKAAWDEVPEELKVIGVNDTFNASEEQDTVVSNKEENTVVDYIETEETKTETISFPLAEEIRKKENFLPFENNYPVRTEDVVVALKETETDSGLLLEYLNFLEEKRSIFRKNKKKEGEIIDKIIKEDPTIPKLDRNNLPDNSVDLSSKSITINKGPVSENFAKILSLQGKRDKAIEIYEQLILKNPEKKPYFEAQIEKLKNRI